jgi:hypothetical protein
VTLDIDLHKSYIAERQNIGTHDAVAGSLLRFAPVKCPERV